MKIIGRRLLVCCVLTLAVIFLAGSLGAQALTPDQCDRIKFVDNNHVPLKLLVVHSYSTGKFVKDLFNAVKAINEEERLPESERFKLHIISSSGDPTSSLGISAEDAKKYVEVNTRFHSSDQWIQDCMEICSAKVKGQDKYVPAMFDSQRGRGLGGLPKTLADMWGLVFYQNPTTQASHGDYGGNLEVAPFDDVLVCGNTITSPCKAYLEKNGYAGRIFTPDTRWLSVGHIDEYLNYIPTPHVPGGYSIVRADPNYALELITNIDESELSEIDSYDRSFLLKVKATLQARMTDPAAGRGTDAGDFIDLNRAISDIIEKNVGELKNFIRKVTNDPDRDFAEVAWPSLYEGYGGSKPSSCHAFLPGVVNLTVVRNHLLVPACHIPSLDRIIEARFRAQGNKVHFIDDEPYHDSMGEIHCGTNLLRDVERTVVTPAQVRAVSAVRAKFKAIHGGH